MELPPPAHAVTVSAEAVTKNVGCPSDRKALLSALTSVQLAPPIRPASGVIAISTAPLPQPANTTNPAASTSRLRPITAAGPVGAIVVPPRTSVHPPRAGSNPCVLREDAMMVVHVEASTAPR